jgi:hypothetical protein
VSISVRWRSLPNADCPWWLGRNATIVGLFSFRLAAGALDADTSLPRAAQALSRQSRVT